jgi:3-methyladenine DNA glycosylase AlkC
VRRVSSDYRKRRYSSVSFRRFIFLQPACVSRATCRTEHENDKVRRLSLCAPMLISHR